jgi:hypothetical protein
MLQFLCMDDSRKNIAERAAALEDALDSLVAEAGYLLRKSEYWMLSDTIEVLKGIQKRVSPQMAQFVRVENGHTHSGEDLTS